MGTSCLPPPSPGTSSSSYRRSAGNSSHLSGDHSSASSVKRGGALSRTCGCREATTLCPQAPALTRREPALPLPLWGMGTGTDHLPRATMSSSPTVGPTVLQPQGAEQLGLSLGSWPQTSPG